MTGPSKTKRVTTRNAGFQQWQSYLTNRSKRSKAGSFLIQGVRPVRMALDNSWPVESVLYNSSARLSSWAQSVVDGAPGDTYAVAPELMAELGEKADSPPEILLVARTRTLKPAQLELPDRGALIVIIDRPQYPGNVGTMIRSADAFGAQAVIITGHGADHYDPQSVRASTGSLFGMQVATADGVDDASRWNGRAEFTIVGTDESGPDNVFDCNLTGNTALVIGNEGRGLSRGWLEACDSMARIPIVGTASSLSAPSACAAVLYEAARQRSAAGR